MTSPFTSPYEGFEPQDLGPIQIWVPKSLKAHLKTIRPKEGTEVITLAILHQKLIQALGREGIRDHHQMEAFEQFVQRLELAIPQPTP